MSTRVAYGIAGLLASVALAGCQAAASAEEETLPEVASVETPTDGGPGIVTLAPAAQERLGIETTPVEEGPDGLVVPYAALVYATDGSSWVYVQLEDATYQRAEVAVRHKDGENLLLESGPEAGTPVVTVGAPELVGVETGIDGEE
jgi:hypothetical protein